jgi:hypothetical protein
VVFLLQGGFEMIQNYLKNYSLIFEHMKNEKSVLATFYPGQMVQGKISKVHGNGMQVQLESGVKGYLSSYHSHGIKPDTIIQPILINHLPHRLPI